MGIIRRLREWREKADGTLSGPALETDTINDANDGKPWETLRGAGYETGDIAPIAVYDSALTLSTTNTTFINSFSQIRALINWDSQTPTNGDVYVDLTAQFSFSDSGADRVYQLFNVFDNEVVGDAIGPTGSGNQRMGWTRYEPTTTNSLIEIRPQLKRTGGSSGDSVEVVAPTFLIGVEI